MSEYYQSRFEGEEIDRGIGMILDGTVDNLVSRAETAATNAEESEENAKTSENKSDESQKKAESWAVGGTGTREGEDNNNAKYWAEQAHNAAGGGVSSFNGRAGFVLPQSGDYTAEMVGAAPVGLSMAHTGIVSNEEIDAVISAQFEAMADRTVRIFTMNVGKGGLALAGGVWAITLYKTSGLYGCLTAINYGASVPVTMIRTYSNGVWLAWSTNNPSMAFGVEYLTSEQYNGKPVYRKLASDGTMLWREDGETIWSADIAPRKNWIDNNRMEINQRGKDSYTNADTINYISTKATDRWGVVNGTITLNDGYYSVTGEVRQNLSAGQKKIVLKNHTLSVLAKVPVGKRLILGYYTNASNNYGSVTCVGTGQYTLYSNILSGSNSDVTSLRFYFFDTTNVAEVKAAKIEEGEGQTLAHKDAAGVWQLFDDYDYNADLFECQKYLWIPCGADTGASNVGVRAYLVSSNALFFAVPVPAKMRTNSPSVVGSISVRSLSGVTQTGFSFTIESGQNMIYVYATKTGHGLTDGFLDFVRGSGFSSEL